MSAKLTTAQRRALEVLRDHGPLTPSGLANHLWPNSCQRMSNVGGYGAAAGVGANLKAGQFLSHLNKLLYTEQEYCGGYTLHRISEFGQRTLESQPL
jgi:hypothetical protein